MVLLSGGADSAACLAFYRDLGHTVCGLFVDYGQPANNREKLAASDVARHYGVRLATAQWRGIQKKDKGYTPGRNAFLLSAALMELPSSISGVALGIHSGTDYVDCTPEFIESLQNVYNLYSKPRVKVLTPFVSWSKGDIWTFARSLLVPLSLTYSCESGDTPCRRCDSCKDRAALNDEA